MRNKMNGLKRTKPEPFDSQRDVLKINTCLYKMELYFYPLLIVIPQLQFNDQTKMNLESSLMTGAAPIRWYMKVLSQATPQPWEHLKAAIRIEFTPIGYIGRSTDKVRNLLLHSNVAKFLNEFGNLFLTISDIKYGEKLDKWGIIIPLVRLEVFTAGPGNVDDAERIAENVENALFWVGMFQGVQIIWPTPYRYFKLTM